MNCIDEIFLRANIQHIRSFLLYGTEELRIDPRPYGERIKSATQRLTDHLHELYTDKDEFENETALLFDCLDAYESVYMELGLQAGSLLAAQTYQNITPAPTQDQ